MPHTTIIINNMTHQSQQYGLCTSDNIPPDKTVDFADCPIIAAGKSTTFNASIQDRYATVGLVTAGALIDHASIQRGEDTGIGTVNLSKMVHILHLDLRDHPSGTFIVMSKNDGITIDEVVPRE